MSIARLPTKKGWKMMILEEEEEEEEEEKRSSSAHRPPPSCYLITINFVGRRG
jgi:hypothetical protein